MIMMGEERLVLEKLTLTWVFPTESITMYHTEAIPTDSCLSISTRLHNFSIHGVYTSETSLSRSPLSFFNTPLSCDQLDQIIKPFLSQSFAPTAGAR